MRPDAGLSVFPPIVSTQVVGGQAPAILLQQRTCFRGPCKSKKLHVQKSFQHVFLSVRRCFYVYLSAFLASKFRTVPRHAPRCPPRHRMSGSMSVVRMNPVQLLSESAFDRHTPQKIFFIIKTAVPSGKRWHRVGISAQPRRTSVGPARHSVCATAGHGLRRQGPPRLRFSPAIPGQKHPAQGRAKRWSLFPVPAILYPAPHSPCRGPQSSILSFHTGLHPTIPEVEICNPR